MEVILLGHSVPMKDIVFLQDRLIYKWLQNARLAAGYNPAYLGWGGQKSMGNRQSPRVSALCYRKVALGEGDLAHAGVILGSEPGALF
ncbi:hypothetical protein [Ferrimonas sp. YFM]|uniref:hypothetical protein n=1 Tax=Ferrimonas sp. YFM TaxID=3028878 RepID=UPI0025723421|nr:hypothetical protein [Ferrimonas sp. YFM]